MRVAFLHFWTLRLRRGIETMVLSLANELARRGEDVSILSARQTQEPLVKLLPQVHLRQFPTFRYYEAATIVPFYVTSLIRYQYDVVVAFLADYGEGPSLRLSSHLTRSCLFLYLTFPYEAAPHRYRSFLRWGWDSSASCILADAEHTAMHAEGLFGRKVHLLPSATDPSRFRPDQHLRLTARRLLGLDDKDVVLLNVSSLEQRKGVSRVIEMLPMILASCPTILYLILGEGPERAGLQRRVHELGLTERVVFAGTTADLAPFYNAADIFVMLSDAEAGSIACLEAMASGLPTVVSSRGGFSEVVTDRCGRLVALDAPPMAIEAILQLARDAALRKQLGEEGRRIVIEQYSWGRIADRFLDLAQQATRDR